MPRSPAAQPGRSPPSAARHPLGARQAAAPPRLEQTLPGAAQAPPRLLLLPAGCSSGARQGMLGGSGGSSNGRDLSLPGEPAAQLQRAARRALPEGVRDCGAPHAALP